MNRLLYLLLCLVLGGYAGAQIFPVQLDQQLTNPTGRVTDFGSPAVNQYRLSLRLLDPRESSVQVLLRLKIESNDLRIVSRAGMSPVFHTVEFGTPLDLSGADLGYLFAPANLVVAGPAAAEYQNNGGLLPEGFYNICVEAFLPTRADAAGVSGEHCLPLFLTVNEPPLVTYPIANQAVPVNDPQNFAITWQNQGSPSGTVSYDLEITPLGNPPGMAGGNLSRGVPTVNGGQGAVQQNGSPFRRFNNYSQFPQGNLIPVGNAPNVIAPLIFVRDLMTPTYQLRPGDPTLLPGQQYTVRVRAFDPLGGSSFRNGGWSQPVVFTYGLPCPAPFGVTTQPLSDQQVMVNWAGGGDANGYTFRFRNAGGLFMANGPGNWYEISTQNPFLTVDQLELATRYEYELVANCYGVPGTPVRGFFSTPGLPVVVDNSGGDDVTVSPTYTPTVAGATDEGDPFDKPIAECDANAQLVAIPGGQPDPNSSLSANGEFTVTGMRVRAKEVNGSASSGFTGKGTLLLPWLKQGAIAVTFTDVKLNAAGALVQGLVTPERGKEKLDPKQFKTTLGQAEECANYTEIVLDERGFDANGIHYITGTNLDPYGFDKVGNYQGQNGTTHDDNGFDANGIHQTTGTAYNPAGCSRDGLNEGGQPCSSGVNPPAVAENNAPATPPDQNAANQAAENARAAGILDEGYTPAGSPNPAGTKFSEGLDEFELEQLVSESIDSLLVEIQGRLDNFQFVQRLASGAIDLLVSLTDLERDVLIGANDELLEPGMSKLYGDEFPDIDLTDADLSYKAYVVAMEKVFDLDRYQVDTLEPLRILYIDHQFGNPLEDMTDHVSDYLKAATATDTLGWSFDRDGLLSFVKEKVKRKVTQLFENPNAGYGEWANPVRDRLAWGMGETALAGDAYAGWVNGAGDDDNLPDKLRKYGITNYDPLLGWKLPIKLDTTIAGKKYTLFIEDIRFAATGAQTDVMIVLPMPGKDGEYIAFEGKNIPLTPGGFQGTQQIGLVSQVDIGLGTYGTLKLDKNNQNYVQFSCDGYEGFQLKGGVEFCRDKVMPLDDAGELIEDQNERVTATFQVTGDEWPNFLTRLDVENDARFAVKGLREVHWEADEIWLDFSETQAATNVQFPEGYSHAHVNGRTPQPLWEGVHFTRVKAELDFLNEKSKQQKKLGFEVENLIIDDTGVSVKVTADNVVARDGSKAPKIGKWDIAVDTVVVEIMQSAFEQARIVGDVILPNRERDKFGYVGQASEGGGFSFSATLEKEKTFKWDSWKGEITMLPNTSFEMLRDPNLGWNVRASLYGRLKLGIRETDKFKVPDVAFSDFRLASFAPYIDLGPQGEFGIRDGAVSLAGFGLEIGYLGFVKRRQNNEDQFGIKVDATVSLLGGSSGFSGTGGATVWGSVDDSGDDLDFDYEDLDVAKIGLSVKVPGVYIAGQIEFFKDDPKFGTGFQGGLAGKFDGVGLSLSVAGMFGRKFGKSYFFVDGMVGLPLAASIPLVTPVHLTGIGGGVYWRMARAMGGPTPQNIDFFASPVNRPLGVGLSGIPYVPVDRGIAGLRLMTSIATVPTASVMNGSLMLEASIDTDNGGLNKINFNGSAAIMTPTEPNGQPKKNADPVVEVAMAIEYAHRDRRLSGTLEGYLSYGVGNVGIFGANTKGRRNNYLGAIEFLSEPGRWFVYMGRPDKGKRLGVSLKPIGLTVQTYMDVGSELPAFPALEAKYSGLGLKSLATPAGTSGFMHGFKADVPSTGKKNFTFWRIRASLKAGFGYDLILTNSLKCQGRDNFGIGNWYLRGQAYAFVFGGVVFNSDWDIDWSPKEANLWTLASFSAYAALQVEGPNPTYVAGGAAIDYDVLKWKGTKTVNFAFGDDCTLINRPPNPLENKLFFPFQDIIAYGEPGSGAMNIGPNSGVIIHTNHAVGSPFTLNHNGQERTFRLTADPAQTYVKELATNGQMLTGNRKLQQAGTKVILRPKNMDYDMEYEYQTVIFVEEKVNGSWRTFTENGQPYDHKWNAKFRTVKRPDFALIQNVTPVDQTDGLNPVGAEFLADYSLNRVRSWYRQQGSSIANSNLEVKLEEYELRELQPNGTNTTTTVDLTLTRSSDQFKFTPDRTLKDETRYRLSFKARVLRPGDAGMYPISLTDGVYEEEFTVEFKTGKRQTKLSPSDIVRSYPAPMQYNTYRDQRTEDNFIVLQRPLTETFGEDYRSILQELRVEYYDNVTDQLVTWSKVIVSGNKLTWNKLPANLGLDKTYQMVLRLKAGGIASSGNSNMVVTQMAQANPVIMSFFGANGASMAGSQAGSEAAAEEDAGEVSQFEAVNYTYGSNGVTPITEDNGTNFPNNHVLYRSWFRTSASPTFAEKVAALGLETTEKVDVNGTVSPRIWDQPTASNVTVPSYQNSENEFPYLEDLSNRNLGFIARRTATNPAELFSDQELTEDENLPGVRITQDYENGYLAILRQYFDFSETKILPSCFDGSDGGEITLTDYAPHGSVTLEQFVDGVVLSEDSGHNLSTGNGGTLTPTQYPTPEAPTPTLFPSVDELRNSSYFNIGQEYRVPAPDRGLLALTSTLPLDAAVKYNRSWLFRYRAIHLQSRPCDPPSNNADLANFNPDGYLIDALEMMDMIDDIENGILFEEVAGNTFGNPLEGNDGSGGVNPIQPGNGGQGPNFGGGNLGQVIVNNGVNTTQTVVQQNFAGQTVTFQSSGGMNLQNGGQSMNAMGIRDGGPMGVRQADFGGGFSLNVVPDWLLSAISESTDPMVYPLPSAAGQDMRVQLLYTLKDVDGQEEIHRANPINLKVN